MYGKIAKLTIADSGKSYYVEVSNYRAHYPDPLDKGTRIELCFNGSDMRQLVVLEDCETVHRLFDSEYAEKMAEIESAGVIVTEPPPSKFCKLKSDPIFEELGGVLEIMGFDQEDGRYHVKIVDFPEEGAYVYPHEIEYVQYDPNNPNIPAQPLNPIIQTYPPNH